jgi:phosphoenolpyruvate carboxykinase (ATP)
MKLSDQDITGRGSGLIQLPEDDLIAQALERGEGQRKGGTFPATTENSQAGRRKKHVVRSAPSRRHHLVGE